MSDPKKWLLVKPDEDGNTNRWLTDQEMREVLADPAAWGIDEFVHIDELAGRPNGSYDPNYWPDRTAVLMRIEVVVPERGGWRLPEDCSPASTVHVAVDDYTCSCGGKVDGFTAPEFAREKLYTKHILPETMSAGADVRTGASR